MINSFEAQSGFPDFRHVFPDDLKYQEAYADLGELLLPCAQSGIINSVQRVGS
jgi:hypothetical protein